MLVAVYRWERRIDQRRIAYMRRVLRRVLSREWSVSGTSYISAGAPG